MRHLLLLLLLGPLSGCLIIEDEIFFVDGGCPAPGASAPPIISTAEPPRAGAVPIVQTGAVMPVQTGEPPR